MWHNSTYRGILLPWMPHWFSVSRVGLSSRPTSGVHFGLAPGDRLHLQVTGQRLVLERQQDALTELRRLASPVPKERSLVDELIADRRLAAAAE